MATPSSATLHLDHETRGGALIRLDHILRRAPFSRQWLHAFDPSTQAARFRTATSLAFTGMVRRHGQRSFAGPTVSGELGKPFAATAQESDDISH
jgi:hypothetical protein